MLSCAREKATAVTCTWAAPDAGQRENTETVAKQKQPLSRPKHHARGARPVDHVSTNYKYFIKQRLEPESIIIIHKICIKL